MAGTVASSGTIAPTANTATAPLSASSNYTQDGSLLLNQVQTVTAAGGWTAINIGALATIGPLMLKVLPGTGTQHLDIALTAASTYRFSSPPDGDWIKLVEPPAVLYVLASSGTLSFQICATDQ